MKVLALSKINFDKMMALYAIDDSNVESQDAIFISICSPKEDGQFDQFYISQLSKESYFKSEHPNVKIMYFGDYGEKEIENNPHVFTKKQAKELYEFIVANKDKNMAIVHCGGGYSRSGAIATFIFDNFGGYDYEEFKRRNPQILPNMHILRMLSDVKNDTN
jgi:hypothetical protein